MLSRKEQLEAQTVALKYVVNLILAYAERRTQPLAAFASVTSFDGRSLRPLNDLAEAEALTRRVEWWLERVPQAASELSAAVTKTDALMLGHQLSAAQIDAVQALWSRVIAGSMALA